MIKVVFHFEGIKWEIKAMQCLEEFGFIFCLKLRNGVLLFFLSEYGQNRLQWGKHDHHILSIIQVSITQTGSSHFRKSYKSTKFPTMA